jgi:hypothetical protein
VWSQVLKGLALGGLLGATAPALDLKACGLEALSAGAGIPPTAINAQVGAGLCAAVIMGLCWSLLHSISPREKLAMDVASVDGTHDLSAANEDELLRGMRPGLRAVSFGARCVTVALETLVDALLIFVFLPSAFEGADAPTAGRGSAAASAAAALVYGSQHLRFRGEWLLCALFGLSLEVLTTHGFDGSLLASLLAMVVFAVFRHARRTGLDVRRFHAS